MMPDIDGITVCRMLKEDPATQLIPIVIMTALSATEDRVRGIEAGADDFLTKPVDDRELLARINTLLKTKRVVDQKVDELQSASTQLERMGTHEEDLSVLIIELESAAEEPSADTFLSLSRRYRATYADVLAMFSGEVSQTEDSRMVAVIRTDDLEIHPRKAAEAAYALIAETEALNLNNTLTPISATVGISSGKASIGSERIKQATGALWELRVEGPVVEQASISASRSPRGTVFADEDFLARTEGQFAAGASDGSLQIASAETELDKADEAQKDRSSLLWPSEFIELESAAKADWGIEDLYIYRVLSGKSGAFVYTVDITAREYSGQAILKLTDLDDPDLGEMDESTRHRHAIEANPTYARYHLPEVVATVEQDQHMASLATIAARGLEYTMPWAHCTYDIQSETALQLSNDLLEAWNDSYRFVDGMTNPKELLSAWLKYRLDPDQSRLWDFLPTVCSIQPEAPTFFFEGHWYPNPLAFALGLIDVPVNLALRAIVGNVHGDLHGYNVLVGNENQYHLIDLAYYQSDAYLLYDHAYFELAHMLSQRGSAPLGEWMSLVEALEGGSTPRADDVGLLQLMGQVRGQVSSWIDRHEPNRLSYLDSQFMLARIGVGLNFANKGMPQNLRIRSLLYGAQCLKTYLKFHHVDWPKLGDVFQVPDQSNGS